MYALAARRAAQKFTLKNKKKGKKHFKALKYTRPAAPRVEWVLIGMGIAGAAGMGFALGAHFAPGSSALRNAVRSLRQQNHQLERQILEGAEPAEPAGGGTDLSMLSALLTEGGIDWKALIPIVLRNPDLLKVGIQAIQAKGGGGEPGATAPAGPAGGAAGAASRPATHI